MQLQRLTGLTILAALVLACGCSDGTDSPDGGGGDGGATPDLAEFPSELVFETEHKDEIAQLSQTRDRLLSVDSSSHYHLWDLSTKTSLLHGSTKSTAALGGKLLVAQPMDFVVYDATDGHSVFTVAAASATGVGPASDGSYVWATSPTALQVFSAAGASLFSISGDYSKAKVFAAPGELRVGQGGKGADVVELVAVPGGTAKTTPAFQGAFHEWFVNGGYFMTLGSGVLHVYTAAGATQGVFVLMNNNDEFGGIKDFIWVYGRLTPGSPLKFYPAAGGTTPKATFSLSVSSKVVPTANGLGVLDYGVHDLHMVTFPAGNPQLSASVSPLSYHAGFGMDELGAWTVGNGQGNLYYSDPSGATAAGQLGYGAPLSAGGSGAVGGAAVAALGFAMKTLAFDLKKTPAAKLVELDHGGARVEVTSDANTLVASSADYSQYTVRFIKVFTLPAGTETQKWGFNDGVNPYLFDFTLAAGGSRIAIYTGVPPNLGRQVTDLRGMLNEFSDLAAPSPFLLPSDGQHYATASERGTGMTTQLYRKGVLTSGIDGHAVGWIDGGKLLVNSYVYMRAGGLMFDSARVVDPDGKLLYKLPMSIPEITAFDPLPGDRLYSRANDTIYDLTTGKAVFTGLGIPGHAVGGSIVYVKGREFRRVKY